MTEEALFELVLNTPEAERSVLLDRECADNPALRHRMEALLAADGPTGLFVPNLTGHLPPDAHESSAVCETVGEAGQVIAGRYTLLEVIGEGGMGSVWRANQTEPVKRQVAVKLIRAGMDSRQVLARFEAERQALAMMEHPNIARILDGGLHENRPFFVMELVRGTPITEFCDARKLTPRQRLELFIPVCQAIQHAHQKGIIHRDIKPSNVLVALFDDKPVPKVIDFGVAKATAGTLTEHTIDTGFGGVVGTPQYMSPEQATFNNLDIDTRSDVYSLGVLLYELLAGSPPFSGKELKQKGLLEILRVVREEEPPRPSMKLSTSDAKPSISANRGIEPARLTGLLKGELDWIVMRALEKDRSRRYESATSFSADVQRYLNGEAVQAHPPGRGYRLRKFVRRNRATVIAASLIGIVLIGGITGTTFGLLRAEDARSEAVQSAKTAREEADTSREVIRFLTEGILGQNDPTQQPDRDLKLRTVLNRAAEKIEGQLQNQPLVEAGIREMIGNSYHHLGEYELARFHLDRAIELYRHHRGDNAPATLSARHRRVSLDLSSGDIQNSGRQLNEVLTELQKTHGPDSAEGFAVMNNLAIVYWKEKNFEEAEKLYLRIIEGLRRRNSSDDRTVYKPLSNLGVLYTTTKQYDKAEPILREVLAARKRIFGDDHIETAEVKYNLHSVLWNHNQREEAWGLLEEAVPVVRRVLGDDNPAAAVILYHYAFQMILNDEKLKAQPLMCGCLKAERKAPGTTEGLMIGASLNFNMLMLANHFAPARELSEEILLTAEKTEPRGWWQFAARSMIGETHIKEMKYAQAEPLLKAGYEGLRQAINPQDKTGISELRDAIKRLIRFSRETKKSDDEKKWQKELDQLPKE